jgi:hypothetical protein
MPPQRSRRNHTRIISYHFNQFDQRRMDIYEYEGNANEDGLPNEVQPNNNYTFSTSRLYQQRNIGLRPLIRDPGMEQPRMDGQLPRNNVDILEPPLPQSVLQYQRFRRTVDRFQEEWFTIFSNIPCAYCGVLSSSRTVKWLSAEVAELERNNFELTTVLHIPVMEDAAGRVAVCVQCKKKPRRTLSAGPWPHVLTQIPPRSRMFLSPLKINCNLGRSQSHSSSNYHNPYTTYRTLSGIYAAPQLP